MERNQFRDQPIHRHRHATLIGIETAQVTRSFRTMAVPHRLIGHSCGRGAAIGQTESIGVLACCAHPLGALKSQHLGLPANDLLRLVFLKAVTHDWSTQLHRPALAGLLSLFQKLRPVPP